MASSTSADVRRRERRTEEPTIKQEEEDRGKKKTTPPYHRVSSPHLPLWELALYVLVVVVVYSYATYQLYEASQDFQRKTINGRGLLHPGWKILGERHQDVMPAEWHHWKFFTLHRTPLAVYAGHMMGGFLVSKYLPNIRKGFLICSSLGGTAIIVGPHVFAFLFSHAIIVYLVAVLFCRSWLVWMVVLCQLALTVVSPFSHHQLSLLPGIREYRVKFIIAMAFCCLRFIAFGVGYVKQRKGRGGGSDTKCSENKDEDVGDVWSIWDYFLYVFYLPTSTHGPFMPPQVFFHQIKEPYYPSSLVEVRWVAIQWLRPIICALFLEFIHHYFYFSSFMFLPQYLKTMPLLALFALGEWCTIIFQIQYIVYYGFARAMALFDGVLTPDLPACMQTVITATHGWRYFDRGEYQFILRNIYIPFGGSQHGGLRRYLALIICYCFTCFWHGFNYHIIVMVVTFWVLVQWEAFSPIIARKLGFQQVVEKLSPLTRRRLGCILSGGKYPILVLSMVFFINNVQVGNIFLQRALGGEGALWVIAGLVSVHYCHVQLIEECFSRWGKKYVMEKYYMAPPQL